MNRNQVLAIVLIIGSVSVGIAGIVTFFAIDRTTVSPAGTSALATPATTPTTTIVSATYDPEDLDPEWTYANTSSLVLQGSSIAQDGSGIVIDGTVATITNAGTYRISGTLYDGQIIVDTTDEEPVQLILDGADITCRTSAPVYVQNAEKTVITLADGTENYLTDGVTYVFADAESDEPNAAVFSKDDLTINGGGTLHVTACYNDGITSKDDLKITGGTITVDAVNDGIRGKDSLVIKDGTVTVVAGGDGMQSTNDDDAGKGMVIIEGGTIAITAGADGIQAETSLGISGGTITIETGGGSSSGTDSTSGWDVRGMQTITTDETTESAKGLKAGGMIGITGGYITIDASDDAVHANGSVSVTGGTLRLASGDDGIHADTALVIFDGDIQITTSYEGLESAAVTINGGSIDVTARDDGINVAGGSDGVSVDGRPGQDSFATSGNYMLTINGGTTIIDSGGDGLDSNGAIEITSGTVLVTGPTDNRNGPLDCMSSCTMTGGFLVAVGSSGMAEGLSTTSTQNSLRLIYPATQEAETMIHIESASGGDILTFVPEKTYASLVFCSPGLMTGETYTIWSGGSSTGTSTNGLYSGGTYTGGTVVDTVTISDVVTNIGSSATEGMSRGPGDGGRTMADGGPGGERGMPQ